MTMVDSFRRRIPDRAGRNLHLIQTRIGKDSSNSVQKAAETLFDKSTMYQSHLFTHLLASLLPWDSTNKTAPILRRPALVE